MSRWADMSRDLTFRDNVYPDPRHIRRFLRGRPAERARSLCSKGGVGLGLVLPDSRWRVVEGTLVFVDISGFTNLSERLSRKGRIGAEELTVVLNKVFGDMLEIVFERADPSSSSVATPSSCFSTPKIT